MPVYKIIDVVGVSEESFADAAKRAVAEAAKTGAAILAAPLPGTVKKASEAGIVDETRRMQTRVIFVQVQFAQASARAIARETGTRLVDLDPLGDDYIRDIEQIARKVADGLKDVSSPATQGRDSD